MTISFYSKLCFFCFCFIVLLVESINSAIEAVVDSVGLEHHELSGRAMVLDSSAVFLALTLCFIVWAGVIYGVFSSDQSGLAQ